MKKHDRDTAVKRMSKLLKELREERMISRRQLADEARVNVSVVSRAERGKDAKLSTWEKLFKGLGYQLLWDTTELSEETGDLLIEEKDQRYQRQEAGLYCSGKRY